jgi:hypothetical protein
VEESCPIARFDPCCVVLPDSATRSHYHIQAVVCVGALPAGIIYFVVFRYVKFTLKSKRVEDMEHLNKAKAGASLNSSSTYDKKSRRLLPLS